MSTLRWIEVSWGVEVLVDENEEVHATVREGWRGLTVWGERQFLSRKAAKQAVEIAKGLANDLPF